MATILLARVVIDRPTTMRVVVGAIPVSSGGGSSDHATLSNLSWTLSGHVATVNTLAGFNSAGDAEEIGISTLGRVLVALATAADGRSALGVVIGTDVQAYAAILSTPTATPAPSVIPIADGSGKLDGWISAASTTTAGKVELADNAETQLGTDTVRAVTPAGLASTLASYVLTSALSAYVTSAALAAWTGSTAITTLGTIATGVWNGSAIGASYIGDLSATYIAVAQKAAASGVASLNGSSRVVQDPANATATPTASKIPIADGSGKLDGWLSAASTSAPGLVELATPQEAVDGVSTTLAVTPRGAKSAALSRLVAAQLGGVYTGI